MEHNTGDMAGMMTGMWIFGLLWVAVAIAAIVVVYLTMSRRTDHLPTDTALNALRERYARGEIDAVEYQARSSVLRNTTTRAAGTEQ